MRTPLPALAAGFVVAAVGAAGLIRAAVPQPLSSGAPPSAPIIVSGAYVRAPLPPTTSAAAYFTVTNTTGTPDQLTGVLTGAGSTAVLHVTVKGTMQAADDVVIPAHGKLVLTAGGGHVMIEGLFGTLNPGDNVNLSLTFTNAGTIDINAPVISYSDPAPTASESPAGQSSPSK